MSISSATIVFSYWKKFQKLIKFITQSYLSLLNSLLFLSRFSVSLKSLDNYFFRWFAYKSLLNRLPVLINYIMWSFNNFAISSCFPRFSGSKFFRFQVFLGLGFYRSRFFRVQFFQGSGFHVFQGPGFLGSKSRVQVQVLEVASINNKSWHLHRQQQKTIENNSLNQDSILY